ncbi:MAG: hypothetical protein ACLPXW_01515 [Xanthobacteraceae bacterium]
MTETTAATNKAKTTKHAASSFGLSDYDMLKFEMPKFGLPNTEMPEAFREMAEKGVAHVRDTNARVKAACEQAADLLENTYATFAKGAQDYKAERDLCRSGSLARRWGRALSVQGGHPSPRA